MLQGRLLRICRVVGLGERGLGVRRDLLLGRGRLPSSVVLGSYDAVSWRPDYGII